MQQNLCRDNAIGATRAKKRQTSCLTGQFEGFLPLKVLNREAAESPSLPPAAGVFTRGLSAAGPAPR